MVAAVGGDVDEGDNDSLFAEPCGDPTEAVGPDSVPPPGCRRPAVRGDQVDHLVVAQWTAPAQNEPVRKRARLLGSHGAIVECSLVDAGDEYLVDSRLVHQFVAGVEDVLARALPPAAACDEIRPRFAELLAADGWLPERFAEPAPESGMGGGIGQWLLYRARDGSVSLFSLVVPPGAETPVHDHLAWGLVGLYRGTQDEEIYAHRDGALTLVERRSLATGDFYALIPPEDDIHRVRTTSPETSVSIHLLTNDTGCVWRHAYDPISGEERPFRSGYVNVDCAEP
jgi:3-mercaptopropionate dioxygenase